MRLSTLQTRLALLAGVAGIAVLPLPSAAGFT